MPSSKPTGPADDSKKPGQGTMKASKDPASNIEMIPASDLCFDHHNPRLAEYGIDEATSEEEILRILWEAMDVLELVQSICASGFFQHEALIVAVENDRKIVIEGNRRLAAIKVILNPNLAKANNWDLPVATKGVLATLQKIPAIIASRKDAWRYLGFKHVNGPAKWTSYAKAAYIAQVYKDFKVPLVDIAAQIGDRHNTVQRLYRGLMVLEQAEKAKVYDREDRFSKRLAFSHLYTGLDYEGIGAFLDLKPKEAESTTPIPVEKLPELGELLVWLYGSKKDKKEAVVRSQNPHLRQLNAIVGNRESLSALRSGVELSRAFEISKPPSTVFEEALLAAKRELTTARGYLTTGDDGTEGLLRLSGTIAELAGDIYEEMERKRRGGAAKRKFLTEH